MKILVTGATGFIGSHLVPRLLLAGHEVGCLRRTAPSGDAAESGVASWLTGKNGKGIREALAAFKPDVVAHLAARFIAEHRYEDIGPLVQANVEFGGYLLEAMRETGCSALVYAGTSWQHFREEHYCPANFYAATKQAFSTLADFYLDAASLRLLELHLYDSYGVHDSRKKLMGQLRLAAMSGDELSMSEGAQKLHLVHVEDVARGFAMACEQVVDFPPGQRHVYRLPSMEAISLRELVQIFNAADPARPVRVRWGERPYRLREVFQPWESADVLPGWQPRISLADGLRQLRLGTALPA